MVATFAPGSPSSSNPGFTYTTSTSTPAQSFSVNPAPERDNHVTQRVTSPITFGSETTETFSGTVTGQSGDGNPRGDGQRPERHDRAVQRDPAGRQRRRGRLQLLRSQRHRAGRRHLYQVDGHLHSGDHLVVEPELHLHRLDLDPGAEPHGERPVSTEPTTTSLNAVTSPITFGAETTETFTGTVARPER